MSIQRLPSGCRPTTTRQSPPPTQTLGHSFLRVIRSPWQTSLLPWFQNPHAFGSAYTHHSRGCGGWIIAFAVKYLGIILSSHTLFSSAFCFFLFVCFKSVEWGMASKQSIQNHPNWSKDSFTLRIPCQIVGHSIEEELSGFLPLVIKLLWRTNSASSLHVQTLQHNSWAVNNTFNYTTDSNVWAHI